MFVHRRTSETFYIGRASPVRREEVRAALVKLLETEGGTRQIKTALTETMAASTVDAMGDEGMVDALATGIAAGRYMLVGLRPRLVWTPTFAPMDEPAGEAVPPSKGEPEEEEKWLEIELVDDVDPPVPVAGARYVVELADGTKIEGTLDSQGKARVEGIKKGSKAKVSFPDIDENDWS